MKDKVQKNEETPIIFIDDIPLTHINLLKNK